MSDCLRVRQVGQDRWFVPDLLLKVPPDLPRINRVKIFSPFHFPRRQLEKWNVESGDKKTAAVQEERSRVANQIRGEVWRLRSNLSKSEVSINQIKRTLVDALNFFFAEALSAGHDIRFVDVA
jgi:hypothetical protein